MSEPRPSLAFARGVRLRRMEDGAAVLLVPEGVANLSPTAAAVAALVDGVRDEDEIVACLSASFDATPSTIASDVRELLARFAAKGWLAADVPAARDTP